MVEHVINHRHDARHSVIAPDVKHVSPASTGPERWGRVRLATRDAAQSTPMKDPLLPLHMGSLHPYEQLLVYGLAFGPFLLLGLVIVVRRRQDRREDDQRDK